MKIELLKRAVDRSPPIRESAPRVVVVDDEMVRRYWPNADPIGKRITFADDMAAADVEWITVDRRRRTHSPRRAGRRTSCAAGTARYCSGRPRR